MSFAPNDMMMELFRSEVESHAETLTSSLLQLERDPSDISVLDSMMRSAHSIKGAARIVRVDSAVDVAHVMEDCFVAAQRSELAIKPSDVDVLLRSVDLLIRIAEATKATDSNWELIDAEAKQNATLLACIREGKAIAVPSAPVAAAPSPPVDVPGPSIEVPDVRIEVPDSSINDPAITAPSTDEGRETTLRFGASLDGSHAEVMRRELLHALGAGRDKIRFDLSATKALDAIGLAFLVLSKTYVESQTASPLVFEPVSDELRLVLRLSGIVPS
jgi:HPt (histidine-containing phosphotransfer) domain-containing protein/anti-anti-sigma regulatory factor